MNCPSDIRGTKKMIKWEDVLKELDALDRTDKEEIHLAVKIASAVIDRRTELGWNRSELAKRAGLKESVIADLEEGIVPRSETLKKIFDALGIK
jgi:ribosome-binding protein aMBF1 (putative translation factor)